MRIITFDILLLVVTAVLVVVLASAVQVTGFVPSAVTPSRTKFNRSSREKVPSRLPLLASKSSSSSAVDSNNKSSPLTEKQLDFTLGYLNKHHEDLLTEFARAFSSVGSEMAKANVWSGGSYAIESTEITAISTESLTLKVTVKLRGKDKAKVETVSVPLDSDPVPESKRKYVPKPPVKRFEGISWTSIDCITRKLCRLCWMVQKPEVTGKLIQLACQLGGDNIGKLPENMYLNQ